MFYDQHTFGSWAASTFVLYICPSCTALLPNIIIAKKIVFLNSHKYIISHISLSMAQF